MRNVNRRTFLSAAATATALGGSGLAAGTPSNGNESSASGQFQFDAANTGYASDRTGPKQYLAETWEFDGLHAGIRRGAPTVVDGTIYTAMVEDDRGPGQGALFAIDTDGTQRWKTELTGMTDATPAVADGTVYIGDTQNVHAIDANTGKIQWSFGTGSELSPTLDGDTVYVTADGTLYALDTADGSVRWQFQSDNTDEYGYQAELTSSVARSDGRLYLVDDANSIFCLDASTGTKQWEQSLDSVSMPTVADGTVFVGIGTLSALNAETGEQQWQVVQSGEPSLSFGGYSSAVANGMVYHVADTLTAYDANTGEQQWSLFEDKYHNTPIVADGAVYIVTQGGGMLSIDATDGTFLGQLLEDGRGNMLESTATVADGTAYFGTYDLSDGGNLWAVTEDPDDWKAKPAAWIDSYPDTAKISEPVEFSATADANQGIAYRDEIVEYRWDFDGDGTTDATTEDDGIEHSYDEPGEYDATVTVVDSYGWTATGSTTVEVTDEAYTAPSPPTARIETTPKDAESRKLGRGATVTLDASSSTAPDGEITDYEWKTGSVYDATRRDETTLEVQFDGSSCTPNAVQVKLTVTDGDGETDTTEVWLETR